MSRKYSDWFGEGDTDNDVAEAIADHGQPERVLYESRGFMAALVYPNKVVVVGYDGNEYQHTFVMDEPQDSAPLCK